MAQYRCDVCYYIYDEEKQGLGWEKLHQGWLCPVCQSPVSVFSQIKEAQQSEQISNEPAIDNKILEQTVSDLMIETMINWGVKCVFGMVGHSNLGLAEAIRKQCENGKLTFIGIRHEGAAAFAASAYGKLKGEPAACLAIAGPGGTNLLTGLWDAKMDRVPILALTGQVDIQFLGPGSFQELDLSAAFQSVACFSQTVLNESNHPELMSLALKHAILKRDVSHLTFPNQVQEIPASAGAVSSGPDGRVPHLDITPPKQSIEKALVMIRKAEKPVIIIGHGAKFCMDRIQQFAEQMNLPIITTFKGKGLIPDRHPLACGVLGLSGTPVAGHFMSDSDLLIVMGASFSKHTGIMKEKATIHIDFDPMGLGKFHAVATPVWGEIDTTVEIFIKKLLNDPPKKDRKDELKDQWTQWREEKQKRREKDRGKGVNSASIFSVMSQKVPENAVIAVDVGNNTYSFGRYFESQSQSILMSGYLGSIGFGYPAAIGAWAAAPERPIFCVTGDGGFAQYMGEMTTAVKYNIPIKHILLNNCELGKISKEQRNEGKKIWSTRLINPDFSQFAKNCGALGIRVTKKSELNDGFNQILAHNGPAMLEIIADSELI
jgi:pyruvate oxidase